MKKTLIVDDEPAIRNLFEILLEYMEIGADSVGSGEEALKAIKKNEYDVCFLDIVLPGIDGLEVMRRIRRISPRTKIVLMTGYCSKEQDQNGKDRSDFFLMKPFNISRIEEIMKKLFPHKRDRGDLSGPGRSLRL